MYEGQMYDVHINRTWKIVNRPLENDSSADDEVVLIDDNGLSGGDSPNG